MMKSKIKSAAISLLASSVIMFGCSSDDAAPAASVPSGAVTITDANAVTVVTDAIATGIQILDLLELATAAQITLPVTPGNVLGLARTKIDAIDGAGVASLPTGVLLPPEPCTGGGEVIVDITSTPTSDSGSVTLVNCIELGITLNGVINFNSTSDTPATGDFSDTLTGNISGSDGVDTASLTGLDFNETGNNISGDFSINTFTFAADVTGGEGFLFELDAAIAGNNSNTCPDSGAVLVTGSSNTRGKGTIVPGISIDNDIRVEVDDGSGAFVEATGSPVSCTTVFQ